MKKKILMLAVAACLIVLSIASSSLAYFTDTDAKTNTFTVGNVTITLDYTTVTNTTKLVPGVTYNDTATITVADGSETAYVGAIIKFTSTTADTNALKDFFTFGANTTTTVVGNQIYVVYTNTVAANGTAPIFSKMTIPAGWTNDQMATIQGMEITVTAYATQTVGFAEGTTAADALKAAFTTDWAGYTNP